MPKITRTKEDWKKLLPPEKFHVLIEKGTEPPFTGKFNKNEPTAKSLFFLIF